MATILRNLFLTGLDSDFIIISKKLPDKIPTGILKLHHCIINYSSKLVRNNPHLYSNYIDLYKYNPKYIYLLAQLIYGIMDSQYLDISEIPELLILANFLEINMENYLEYIIKSPITSQSEISQLLDIIYSNKFYLDSTWELLINLIINSDFDFNKNKLLLLLDLPFELSGGILKILINKNYNFVAVHLDILFASKYNKPIQISDNLIQKLSDHNKKFLVNLPETKSKPELVKLFINK